MTTIISGTNRKGSKTLMLARFYQKLFRERGCETPLLSLTDLPSTIIATDLYGLRSKEFQPFQDMVDHSDKFVFIIPEYNGSFPGVLKTFIDCCKYPGSFTGKKAALVGVSSGRYGNIRGVDHFTGICNYIGLEVMPMKIHISHITHELDVHGDLMQEDTLGFVKQQVEKFIEF